jgi:thioredoxin reductase (NADPH)
MQKIFDVLIIGAGPAGLFAAFEAASADLSVCISETLDVPGGQCSILYPEKAIYDLPGHVKISGFDLSNNLMEQLKRFNDLISFIFNSEICFFEKDENEKIFKLKNTNNQEILARTIIVASGGGSFVPNKPQVKNLQYFEKLDQIHYFVQNSLIYKNKTIAIAGGGDSAVDWALALSKNASKIFFIHRRDSMRCHPSSLKELYEIAENSHVEFKIPYIADEILLENKNPVENDSRKMKIILRNFDNEDQKTQIEVDYFLPFFGLKNEIGEIKNWGIEFNSKNKIIVNNHMETNLDGIFGAGDIVFYEGKTKLLVSCFHESSVCVNSVLLYLEKNFGRKKVSFSYSTTKFQE